MLNADAEPTMPVVAVHSRTGISGDPLLLAPRYTGLQILAERNRDGGGSVGISTNDVVYTENRSAFREGNHVKVTHGKKTAWFTIDRPGAVTVAESGADEIITLSGAGPLSWLDRAIVYPVEGQSGTSRAFNFATPDGVWYDPAAWVTPLSLGKAGTSTVIGEGYPAEFPVTDADWLWQVDPSVTPAAPGSAYFRSKFTLTVKSTYRLYISCVGLCRVYIDGQEVATVTEFAAQQRTFSADVDLPAGEHVIGIHNVVQEAGVAGVIAAVTKPSSSEGEGESVGDVILTTDVSRWKAQFYPEYAPGWSPGLILSALVSEAATRGVDGFSDLTLGFDGQVDSNGQPWAAATDWTFDVGTSYRDIVQRFVETACDVWVDDDLVLHLAQDRGVDRSTGADLVAFLYGLNVTSAEAEPSADGVLNTLLVNTSTGLVEIADEGTSVVDHGRREGYLGASDASSNGVARLLAKQVLDQRAVPRMTPTLAIHAIAGATPWEDFDVCDWVLAPSDEDRSVSIRRRVVSIAAEQTDNGMTYALEIDTIAESEDERFARWLTRNDSGALNGAVGASGGSGGSLTASTSVSVVSGDPEVPSAQVPKAPTVGTIGTGSYVDQTGALRASLSLTWAAVTQDTANAPVEIDRYELWGRVTVAGTSSGWTLYSTAQQSPGVVEGLTPGLAYDLMVRAIAKSSGLAGAFSAVKSITSAVDNNPPPAPSQPLVSSRMGAVEVGWNGLTASSTTMPEDFARVVVRIEYDNGGSPVVKTAPIANRFGGGTVVFTGLPYNAVVEATLTAWDTSSNQSAPSVAAETVVVPLVATDLVGQVISGANIVPGSINAAESIIAGTITGAQIAAGSITAQEIAANSISAEQLAAGAVTAQALDADAITGKRIVGSFIEGGEMSAPRIQSAPDLGQGANLLNDPEFDGGLAQWTLTGHDNDLSPKRYDVLNSDWTMPYWKKQIFGPSEHRKVRYKTDFVFESSCQPMPLVGSVGAHLVRAFAAGAMPVNRTVTNPYTPPSSGHGFSEADPFKAMFDEAFVWEARMDVPRDATNDHAFDASALASSPPPVTNGAIATSYLTNTATITVAANEVLAILVTPQNNSGGPGIVSVSYQFIDATSGAVVWERALSQAEIDAASIISAQAVFAAAGTVKFRMKATYRAGGTVLMRSFSSGTTTSWDQFVGEPLHAGNVYSQVGLAGATMYSSQGKTLVVADTSRPDVTSALGRMLASVWQVRSATARRVTTAQGWMLTVNEGFRLWNSAGVLTGRLDGANNFLAGRFATSELGRRVVVDDAGVEFYDSTGTLRSAWGVGATTLTPFDLNTVTWSGPFVLPSAVGINMATFNYPVSDEGGFLEVLTAEDGVRLLQRFTTLSGNRIFIRTRISGTWSPWRVVRDNRRTDWWWMPTSDGFYSELYFRGENGVLSMQGYLMPRALYLTGAYGIGTMPPEFMPQAGGLSRVDTFIPTTVNAQGASFYCKIEANRTLGLWPSPYQGAVTLYPDNHITPHVPPYRIVG